MEKSEFPHIPNQQQEIRHNMLGRLYCKDEISSIVEFTVSKLKLDVSCHLMIIFKTAKTAFADRLLTIILHTLIASLKLVQL